MKLKIISKTNNLLLKRKEIGFRLDHSDEGKTSPRLELKRRLADQLKVKPELVFIEKVETKTGTMVAYGEANIYESAKQAKFVEREHIIARNQPSTPEEVPKEPVKQAPKVAPEEPKPEEKRAQEEETDSTQTTDDTAVETSDKEKGED